VWGFVVRGACYLALGRTGEAFGDLDEAVRMAPNDGMSYSMRGFVHLEAKDYEQALSDLDEAVKRGASSIGTLLNRAVALFKLGRYDSAFSQIRVCRRDYPEAIDGLRTHAWFLATCPEEPFRDGRSALALARSALRLASADDWACQASLAAAYAELGQFDEAVRYAERTLELAPATQHPKFEKHLAAYRAQQAYRDRGSDRST
jgi:tetratricopeptide (TPR) repeat protein